MASQARILIADDDDDLRELLAVLLARDGHYLEEAATGLDLKARMELTHPLDLLITDVRMPGMTGLAVLEVIRGSDRQELRDLPVILMTAFGDHEIYAAAARFGASVLNKPFDIDALRARVSTILTDGADGDPTKP